VFSSIFITSKDLFLNQNTPAKATRTKTQSTGIKTASKIIVIPFYYFLLSDTTGGSGISI
jgi:hypothetical protein